MRKFAKFLLFIMPIALVTSACGNEGTAEDQDAYQDEFGADAQEGGSATLDLAGTSYDLTVDICPTANDSMSDETEQAIITMGMATNENVELSVNGLKSRRGDQSSEEASFSIGVDGGVNDGGKTYRNDMPYAAIDGATVGFTGTAQDISADGSISGEVPVEFSIDCG